MKRLLNIALLLALAAPSMVMADDAHHPPAAASASNEAGVALSEGEVRKVDKEQGKLTLRHGPLANLDMPPMTMVFRVKDAALLDTVAQGDRVRFRAEKVEGQFVVTRLEKM